MKIASILGLTCGLCLAPSMASAYWEGYFVSDITNSGTYPNCTSSGWSNATASVIASFGDSWPILSTEANNCWNSDASYNFFNSNWRQMVSSNPMYMVPGNHDYMQKDRSASAKPDAYLNFGGYNGTAMTQGTYGVIVAMTTPDWFVLGLDSELTGQEMATQFAWLDYALASRSQRCVLVYAHRPGYSNAKKHATDGGRLAPQLTQLLKDRHVDLLFSGHEHVYERFNWDPNVGMIEVVAGTGGATPNSGDIFYDSGEQNYISNPSTATRAETATTGVIRFKLWDEGEYDEGSHAGYDFEYIPTDSGGFRDSVGYTDCNGYYWWPPI